MTRSCTPSLRRSKRRRPGLTLMELVVVMTILAALAAIVIPIFPNLLRRAHKATDCTQTSEMAKMIQLYNALYTSYPDGFDALVDSTGALPGYLPGSGTTTTAFGGFVSSGNLNDGTTAGTTNEVDALASVGIRKLTYLAPTTGAGTTASPFVYPTNAQFHPTMWPYADTPNVVTIDATTNVALLNIAGVQAGNPRFLANVILTETVGSGTGAVLPRFIVVGVGPMCSMVGNTIQDAPTSVPQKSNFTPDSTYSRVGLIFQVSGPSVANADNRARFICSCALEDDELESTEKDIIGYYQVSRDPRQGPAGGPTVTPP